MGWGRSSGKWGSRRGRPGTQWALVCRCGSRRPERTPPCSGRTPCPGPGGRGPGPAGRAQQGWARAAAGASRPPGSPRLHCGGSTAAAPPGPPAPLSGVAVACVPQPVSQGLAILAPCGNWAQRPTDPAQGPAQVWRARPATGVCTPDWRAGVGGGAYMPCGETALQAPLGGRVGCILALQGGGGRHRAERPRSCFTAPEAAEKRGGLALLGLQPCSGKPGGRVAAQGWSRHWAEGVRSQASVGLQLRPLCHAPTPTRCRRAAAGPNRALQGSCLDLRPHPRQATAL